MVVREGAGPVSGMMVTVLMPVHNGQRYLRQSIDSILRQDYADFEFLIIDDGSSDGSADIIQSYDDQRIRFVTNGTRLGLVATLNRGIELATGRYIARMDCDDVCLPARLQRQVDFMEKHPDVGVCGTWVRTIGEKDEIWDYPSGSDEIKCSLVFESVLAHPSVMLRSRHFGGGGYRYDGGFPNAEDYALWVRCAGAMEFANIPEVLLEYRIHPEQTVQRETQGKIISADRVRELQLRSLGIEPTREEMELHHDISTHRFQPSRGFVEHAGSWLKRLASANAASGFFPEPKFSTVLARRWFLVCRAASGTGIGAWMAFRSTSLYDSHGQSTKEEIIFAVKCGLKR